MANQSPNALVFYAVIDADSANSTDRLADGVTLVQFRDLGAAVMPCEYTHMHVGDKELTEYIRVVDQLFKHGPVIPVPPGTVFHDASLLRHWLEIHYAKLHETLGVIEQRDSSIPPYDLVRMELEA